MNISCLFRLHDWKKDCENCSRCGSKRKNRHKWLDDCQKCSECGKTREIDHDWTHDCEKCSNCSKTKNNQHDWSNNCEECSKCGKKRAKKHKLTKASTQCSKCGKTVLPDSMSRLAAKLNDPDMLVRYDAVVEIGNLKDPRSFDLLLDVYMNKKEMDGTREAARDAIWKFDPNWVPNLQGIEILDECVNQLISLYDQTPKGEGFITHSNSAQTVEQIGEKLNEAGGFSLMVLAHGRFKNERPKAARNLEFVWEGIGKWQS
jgi:hypothetical protein